MSPVYALEVFSVPFQKRFDFSVCLFVFLFFNLPVDFIEEGIEVTLLSSTVCSQNSYGVEMIAQFIPDPLVRAFQS